MQDDKNTSLPTSLSEGMGTTQTQESNPIQTAYDEASYDMRKYLEGEQFAKTIALICSANKANEKITNEVNFICLMIALKVLDYNRNTGKEVTDMLIAVDTVAAIASQIWKDIEAYIIPNIPELGLNHVDDGISSLGDTTINRAVTINPNSNDEHVTHFGPDDVEMRLKNIGIPRITLTQLSEGVSLLHTLNIDKPNNTSAKVVNHTSHLDPYRELPE